MQASAPIESGTDVPGRVEIRQGGSAANVARWLGAARASARSSSARSAGTGPGGRSSPSSSATASTSGRSGSPVIEPAGSASSSRRAGSARFVADRRAATRHGGRRTSRPSGSTTSTSSTCRRTRCSSSRSGAAGVRAVELARARGARGVRVSVDLASVGPLLAHGRREARDLVARLQPDVVFATEPEAEALLGRHAPEGLLAHRRGRGDQARLARRPGVRARRPGPRRASRCGSTSPRARSRPRTRRAPATRSTPGSSPAGSARSAAATPAPTRSTAATIAGHRAAARHLREPADGAAARMSRIGRSTAGSRIGCRSPARSRPRSRAGRRSSRSNPRSSATASRTRPTSRSRAASEAAVRESGAVPATVAIRDGRLLVGLDGRGARGARDGARAAPC